MQSANKGQDSQSPAFPSSGQHGMSADMACMSPVTAGGICRAAAFPARGASNKATATEMAIQESTSRFRHMMSCRTRAGGLQMGRVHDFATATPHRCSPLCSRKGLEAAVRNEVDLLAIME